MSDNSTAETHKEVQRYYGETLASSDDLKTSACCTAVAPPDHVRAALSEVHQEVSDRYYGCGLVLPDALQGLRVLDLGCGAGRDVYILARLVGAEGSVVGVDMTPAQLEVATRYEDWHAEQFGYPQPNTQFIEGNIERLDELDLAEGSFDVIVSNCVINLAVDKEAVLRSAFRLLKPGGELYFSDVYADRRIPEALQKDEVLYGECLSGAMYWNDFLGLAKHCGFADPRLVEHEPIEISDPELAARIDGIEFQSVTCRLFRVAELEAVQENYGQSAVYLGTLGEQPDELILDEHHRFISGQPCAVSSNTAAIIVASRFSAYFSDISGKSEHLGELKGFSVTNPFAGVIQKKPATKCC